MAAKAAPLFMLDWLFPALGALGLGALCAPMALALRCRREDLPESWEWGVRLSFFWGGLGLGLRWGPKGLRIAPVLLGRFLPYPSLPLRTRVKRRPKTRRKAEQEAAPKARERNLRALVRQLIKPSLGLLASLPRIIRLKRLQVQGRLGFADPAQTGRIYGYLQAVAAAHQGKIKINVSPDFVRAGAFGRLDLVAHLHLGLLILLLGRFGSQAAYRLLAARFRTEN
ncbi:MAG: DUF2953 domain-containing protein [Gemmatimonadota bacterium]|nr:DUF2953 domain-containing protein [Gemmatimonadota bacterium]